jgi:hypothetical protein
MKLIAAERAAPEQSLTQLFRSIARRGRFGVAPAVLTVLALGVAGLYPIDNPDTFGHLAAGRQIAELGHVPSLDTFSYYRPAPTPFINYEWLSDWLFFLAYRAGGALGLNLFKLGLLAALGVTLVWTGRQRAGQAGAALVALFVIAGLPGLRFRLSVRPQLFGMLFGALYLHGLREILVSERRRTSWAWVCALALVHVLWVNLHGSHLFGLLLIAIAGASTLREPAARKPLAVLLGLALLASCISPYGPKIVIGAIAHTFDPAYRALIEEWQAWRPTQSFWYPVVWLWQAVWFLVALRGLRGQRTQLFDGLCGALLLLMAARSLRFLSDCVALSAPILAAGLAPRVARGDEGRGLAAIGGACGLAALAALYICPQLPPGAHVGLGESSAGRPAASAQWLAAHLPRARILGVMSDAWDLMFSLPRARFLIDGRTPMYGTEHIRRVQTAWGSPRLMRELLDGTHTDVVVAQPMIAEQQPALHALLSFDDFRLVAIEARHCVFARRTPERAALLQASALTTLMPGYDAAWVLSEPVDLGQVARELAKLPDHPNVNAYRDWVRAMVALKPLARAGGRAGFVSPRTAAERRIIRAALELLRECDRELEIVPTVAVYRALTAVAACELDEAHEAFERAERLGRVREITFGEQELALREGELERVRTFMQALSALPEAAHDPWANAIAADLNAPPSCVRETP